MIYERLYFQLLEDMRTSTLSLVSSQQLFSLRGTVCEYDISEVTRPPLLEHLRPRIFVHFHPHPSFYKRSRLKHLESYATKILAIMSRASIDCMISLQDYFHFLISRLFLLSILCEKISNWVMCYILYKRGASTPSDCIKKAIRIADDLRKVSSL